MQRRIIAYLFLCALILDADAFTSAFGGETAKPRSIKVDRILFPAGKGRLSRVKNLQWFEFMAENFESRFPFPSDSTRWYRIDGGETGHLWGKDDYKPHNGIYGAWCAKDGENGLDPQFNNYPNNCNTWLVYGPFDFRDASDAELHFYFWNLSELDKDWFWWTASKTGQWFYGTKVSGYWDSWNFRNFDLTDVPYLGNLCGEDSVWIAFIFQSDETNSYKGAFVDDIALRKEIQEGVYFWPLSRGNTFRYGLTSAFGPRILIVGNDTTFDWHNGLDINEDDNPGTADTVYAVFSGKVYDLSRTHIIIQDALNPNHYLRYFHLDVNDDDIQWGDCVCAGETILGWVNDTHLDVKDYIGHPDTARHSRNSMHILPYTNTNNMTIWGVSSHWPRAAFWVTVPGNELDLNRVRVYGSGTGGWIYDNYVDYDEKHNCGGDNPTDDGITIAPTDFGGYPLNNQVTGFSFRYDARLEGTLDSTITIEAYNIWGVMEVSYSIPVFVESEENEELPREYALSQNFPNPFNPETQISYQLPKDGQVKLYIYNLLGQKVGTLLDGKQRSGRYTVRWNGKSDQGQNLGSGVYFYKIQAGECSFAKKMILLR